MGTEGFGAGDAVRLVGDNSAIISRIFSVLSALSPAFTPGEGGQGGLIAEGTHTSHYLSPSLSCLSQTSLAQRCQHKPKPTPEKAKARVRSGSGPPTRQHNVLNDAGCYN